MNQIFYNANHSPIGAYGSFTLGFPGASGGPGMERTGPANTNVYIGMERRKGESYESFPFFQGGEDESRRYDVEKEAVKKEEGFFDKIPYSEIERTFCAASDTWHAGDLEFTIYNQVRPIPEPENCDEEKLKETIVPAVLAELTIDNTGCQRTRKAFFGFDCVEARYGMRPFRGEKIRGIGQGGSLAIFSGDPDAHPAVGFCPECILTESDRENWMFQLGQTALLVLDVPADTRKTFHFAVCFYHGAQATYGIDTKYYYTKYFRNIEAVGEYALDHYDAIKEKCLEANLAFDREDLTPEQRFMMWHAIKSYYNSSQLLMKEEKPLWIINEGEFRMMNTMDLTVDQLFFEMKMNPWTVKNELDFYLESYSYEDRVCFPGDKKEYEGGLTFCHDMGVANIFAPQGRSAYEKCGLTDCFSYMSHEQVVNWLNCALLYIKQTRDQEWSRRQKETIKRCFASMLHRDHPDPEKRNGVMGLDSSRTKGGAEITTYDSLDVSLGQARNNIYLAGKCWAAYVGLEDYFAENGEPELASRAAEQARRCAETVTEHMTAAGYIPAVMDEDNDSKIIPAIEGLVFPYMLDLKEALDENGTYGEYIRALKKHLETVLKPGVCLFEDGGWKLSSTSNNSWLSKIYLCEFVASQILGFDRRTCTEKADQAHAAWLTHPEHSYWCWSDQIVSGIISASKYYPRGVTSILWLEENMGGVNI